MMATETGWESFKCTAEAGGGAMRTCRFLAVTVALLMMASAALAQPFTIPWFTVDGGGATFSTGGTFSLGGTIGQPDAGATLSGGNFTVAGGFWPSTLPSGTTTTVMSSVNPSTFGQSVTFTATVSSAGGTPTGTVTFKDGAATLGTGNLSSGSASFMTSGLSAGSHSITAVYAGDSNFVGSTSAPLIQVVNPANTATTLMSSLNPSNCGQSVTFTAIVTSPAGTPTGTVTFEDGATTLGTVMLSAGSASLTTAALAVGTHAITATYSGDSNFASSFSDPLDQVVGTGTPERKLVPDGRPMEGTIPQGDTLWLAIPTTIGNSYSVEVKSRTGAGVAAGVGLTIFKGDDVCSTSSSLVTRDTAHLSPGQGSNGVRLSFTANGTDPAYKARVVNGIGDDLGYSISVSDTTMFSPAWTTNGTFDTFWSFQNTTNAAITGLLTLFDLNGNLVQTLAVGPIPPKAIFGTNTVALGVVRNKVGAARFTHDGPPGAVVIKANQANFATSPPFIELVPFEAKRQIR
jgi:hypothetical protein